MRCLCGSTDFDSPTVGDVLGNLCWCMKCGLVWHFPCKLGDQAKKGVDEVMKEKGYEPTITEELVDKSGEVVGTITTGHQTVKQFIDQFVESTAPGMVMITYVENDKMKTMPFYPENIALIIHLWESFNGRKLDEG